MEAKRKSKSQGSRVKPTMIKAGVTKSRNRRYGCGGHLKNK